jgi:Uma2 family endonuclease
MLREMSDPARKKMSADEFIAWALTRPEGEHYELVYGEVVAMAPERSAHGLVKARITYKLSAAVEAAGLPCDVYTAETSVRIDAATLYEPDVLVRCGERLPSDAVEVTDPAIVVEVRSPSTGRHDSGAKLEDYFRLPSVVHYLIVKPDNRTIIHHRRETDGIISTRIVRGGGPILLDPPGIELFDPFPPDR